MQAQIPNRFTYNYKWQNILNYNFTVNEKHDFGITAVTEWTKNRYETSTATANGFGSDSYKFYNLGAATGTPQVASSYTQRQSMGYIGRINYSYLGRYLVTLNARVDGDSRLAKGKKWDIFPGGAVAWRISDEAFMKNVDVVSNLKLRASLSKASLSIHTTATNMQGYGAQPRRKRLPSTTRNRDKCI